MTIAQVARHEPGTSASPGQEPPLVYIVDDDGPAREALESLICSAGWEPRAFASAEEFLGRHRVPVPRCLILDVALPNLDGLALQQRVVEDDGETAVIFVSSHADVATVVKAMKGGATEFFAKPARRDLLLPAVADALEQSRAALARGTEERMYRKRYESLTQRERQVLALVVAGRLNKQIADALRISEITVKAHRGKMMRKMMARSIPDLVRMVGRLDPDAQSGA